jgi:hypothetical protein
MNSIDAWMTAIIGWFENWEVTQNIVVSAVVSIIVYLASQSLIFFLGSHDYL